MKTPLLFFIAVVTLSGVKAQTALKADVGLGYLEHFAVGTTLTLKEKNSFSVHYGSNLFYKTQDFSTLFFQYDRLIPRIMFGKFIPGAGVKFGHTRFSDNYYRWKVISAVPFLIVSRKISDKIEIGAKAGLAISRIESVTRISYGEIGNYKRYLPEVKVSMRYQLLKLSRD